MRCPRKKQDGKRCNCKAVKKGGRSYAGRMVHRFMCSKGHWFEVPATACNA